MAKPAKAGPGTKSKTQEKKTKLCGCGGTMEWTKVAGKGSKGMKFVCGKCGEVD